MSKRKTPKKRYNLSLEEKFLTIFSRLCLLGIAVSLIKWLIELFVI